MPTKKPRIQTILEEKYYKKFSYLCKRDGRSESNMSKFIIQSYIDQYEKVHGEIKTEE